MRTGLILIGIFFCQLFTAQTRVHPIGSYFRDNYFSKPQKLAPIFPMEEEDAHVYSFLKDTTPRYSDFGVFLYQRELIQLAVKDEGNIWITPLFDISLGKTINDSAARRSQNTRGARMEGVLGNNIFFTTSFYENQAVLPQYVREYALQRGEFYPNDTIYSKANAVIPGAARTKPFKEEGFDYAYATGMVRWQIHKKLSIYWGNQSVFIGSGYRSMLLSDNSVPAMNFRLRYRISPLWELQFIKMRGLNLLRRPIATNGEAYYEPTSLSFSTLYFRPNKNMCIGLFEGGVWNRGDSLKKKPIQVAYFIPVPGGAVLQESIDNGANALVGLDASYCFKIGVVYGQLALNVFQAESIVAQIGTRLYPFLNKRISFQMEWNFAQKNAYRNANPRISYANYNLPIAHPMATDVNELVLRAHWEKNHWFASGSWNYYLRQPSDYSVLLPIYQSIDTGFNKVFHQLVEVGYRFNRTIAMEVFCSHRFRLLQLPNENQPSNWVNIGLRTNLSNHYFDF